MTTFNQNTFFEPTNDLRYDTAKEPRRVDKDTQETCHNIVFPTTSKTGTYYNSAGTDKMTRFDIVSDGNALESLSQWSLAVAFTAYELQVADGVTTQAVSVNVGIPACFSCMIDRISLKFNDDSSAVEEYSSTDMYKDATLFRMLQKYDQNRLENYDEVMFTPFFEDALDTTALSTETLARTVRWLTACGDAATVFTKQIPFSDLFSCCNDPSYFANVRKATVEIFWRSTSDIPFKLAAYTTYNPHVGITAVRIDKTAQLMSVSQNLDTLKGRESGQTEKMCFNYFNSATQSYTSNGQVRFTSQANTQGAICAFRATVATGVNYMQYVPNGATSYSIIYGNQNIPRNPIVVSAHYSTAYMYFKKAIGKEGTSQYSPSIPFKYYGTNMFLMWIPITEVMYPKLNMNAKDLTFEVVGATTDQLVVCAVNQHSAQIASDGSVAVSK